MIACDYIVKRVPKWIAERTQDNMDNWGMSLYDAFEESVREWDKEQGRRTAQCMKLSFIRSHTPEEMRRIYQHKREELEKYHESKRKFPDDPLKWYGHPHAKLP